MESASDQVLKTVKGSQELPTIPAVAMSVIRLSRNPDTTLEQLAEALEKDPALAAKTLRFANSSYYGASQSITNLRQALVRLGMRGARMLALSFGLIDACTGSCRDFDFSSFWHRSLVTAIAGRRIAHRTARRLADEAFLGGLLAEIGAPILARTFPDRYKAVDRLFRNGSKGLDVLEREALGVDHAAVGKMLLESWHLPGNLPAAVGAHHCVSMLPRDCEAFTLAVMVMTGGELADIVVRGSSPQRVRALAATFREYFSFTAEHITVLLEDLGPEVEEAGKLLELPLPPVGAMQAAAKSEMLRHAMEQSDRGEPAADRVPS